MPVLAKENYYLAALFQIMQRFFVHVKEIVPDYRVESHRILVNKVFQVERFQFLELLAFARHVLDFNFELQCQFGQSLINSIIQHVLAEFDAGIMLPINRMINVANVEGIPANLSEAFFMENVKDQGLFLKAVVNYVKIVISLKKADFDLVADNENGYDHEVLFNDDLFNPGVRMTDCVFTMTQLLAFQGHLVKMRYAKYIHERNNEEEYMIENLD